MESKKKNVESVSASSEPVVSQRWASAEQSSGVRLALAKSFVHWRLWKDVVQKQTLLTDLTLDSGPQFPLDSVRLSQTRSHFPTADWIPLQSNRLVSVVSTRSVVSLPSAGIPLVGSTPSRRAFYCLCEYRLYLIYAYKPLFIIISAIIRGLLHTDCQLSSAVVVL